MSSNQDFSNKILLAEFDFDGNTYYIGSEGFASEDYYQPIMTSASNISIGSSSGNYMSVDFGNIQISNDPKKKSSPFNLHTGTFATLLNNPNKLIPVRVYWGKQKTALFEGTMYFSAMKEDKMTFVLEAQDFPQNALVERATDNSEDSSSLGDPLFNGGNFSTSFTNAPQIDFTVSLDSWSTTTTTDNAVKLTFTEAHGLTSGQVLFLDFVPTDGTDQVDADIYANNLVRFNGKVPLGSVTITMVDDKNISIKPEYDVGSSVGTPNTLGYWTLYNFPSEVAPWMFGKIEKEDGILKHPDTDDTKYWNPLNHLDTSNYIELYDDGIMVGTNNPLDIDTTIADSSEYWKLSFNTNELGTFKQQYPVTAMYGNGTTPSSTANFPALNVGDQVKVEGSAYASLNGTFQVTRVFSQNNFQYGIYNVGTDITDLSGVVTDNTPRVDKQIIRYGNYFGSQRLPTSEFIYTRAITVALEEGVSNIVGEPLVTGMGAEGETLEEFFLWCKYQLEVPNHNFLKAPNLATSKISVSVKSQIKVTELMGEVAESTNHLCYVRDNILHVIDLSATQDEFVDIPSYEIVSASVANEYPISYIETSFSKKVVYDDEWPIKVEDDETTVRVDNVSVGSSQTVNAVSKVVVDNRTYLQSILSHKKKANMSVTVNDVNLDLLIGTRVKFNREEEQISYDMIVGTISYDFKKLETSFSGRGTISVIERGGIY